MKKNSLLLLTVFVSGLLFYSQPTSAQVTGLQCQTRGGACRAECSEGQSGSSGPCTDNPGTTCCTSGVGAEMVLTQSECQARGGNCENFGYCSHSAVNQRVAQCAGIVGRICCVPNVPLGVSSQEQCASQGGTCKILSASWDGLCPIGETIVNYCRDYPASGNNSNVCCRPTPPSTSSGSTSGSTNNPTFKEYQLLEQIPNSSNTVGRLNTYLQDIYKFAFWTVGIAVVFMLTIGGFMYLTSAGNTSRMESAKTVILDAVLGLVLALVAWLFLYVINPDLVNLNLRSISITPISATPSTAPTGGSIGGSTPSPAQSGNQNCPGVPSGVRCNACANCSVIPGSITNKGCGQSTCYLNSSLLAKISNISGVSGWRITESWPPTVGHASSCHTDGTCADINNSGGGTDPATIKRYYDAFTAAGLNVVYENSSSCAPYTALGIRCGTYATQTNLSSFHVK